MNNTPSYATPIAMQAFLKSKNPMFPYIGKVYWDACDVAGLNALKVFCHALACTDYLRDARAAKNDFFNSGLNMATVADGVAQHVAHLVNIGGLEALPKEEREAMSVTENRFEKYANINQPPVPPLDALKPKPEAPKTPEPLKPKPAWKVKLGIFLSAVGGIVGVVAWFLPGPVGQAIKLVIEALKALVQ